MFQSKPNPEKRNAKQEQIFSSAFKELFHSAGVVIGGLLVTALIVSQEGRH